MRADNLLPHGWLDRYRWAMKEYDLIPFWYPTLWIDIPLAAGSAGSTSIQVGDDYWFYQLGIGAQTQSFEEQEPALGMFKISGLEIRLRIDGNPVFGDYTPAMVYIGGQDACGLGPGWILRRGAVVTIEWRRPIAAQIPNIEKERTQFLLHGCQLARRGSATYGRNRWRNMTLSDFDKRAMLQPMVYTTYGEMSTEGESLVRLDTHIRDRHFILRSIRSFVYEAEDQVEEGSLTSQGGIFAMGLLDEGGSWHPQTEFMSGFALHGEPMGTGYDLRITRIVPANRTIQVIANQSLFDITAEPYVDRRVGIEFWGYEIIADRRGNPPQPDPIERVPFKYRPGAR